MFRTFSHLRQRLLLIVLLILALLLPTVWLPHVESADLPSHLYNAWLRIQVEAGSLSGFTVVPRHTNFLVDLWLAFAMRRFGTNFAEHSLVIGSVLIFFWGLFRFVRVASGRPSWVIAPLLIMLAYGQVFRWGFFNFYLSFGLCLWAASLVMDGRRWRVIASVPLFVLALAAHAMPIVLIGGILAYWICFKTVPETWRKWLFVSAALMLAGVEFVVHHRYRVESMPFSIGQANTWLTIFGLMEVVFSAKYVWPLLLVSGSVAALLWMRRRDYRSGWFAREPLLHLALLSMLASLLTPDLIALPGYALPFSLIQVRIALVTCMLSCALLNRLSIPRGYGVVWAVALSLFFGLVYRDELAAYQVESEIAAAVQQLPAGSRVVVTLVGKTGGLPMLHLGDRACIGHCFDYGNYEPSTAQFPLTAERGNRYVMGNVRDAEAFDHDQYVAKESDLPLIRLDLCKEYEPKVCATPVAVGEALRHRAVIGHRDSFTRLMDSAYGSVRGIVRGPRRWFRDLRGEVANSGT